LTITKRQGRYHSSAKNNNSNNNTNVNPRSQSSFYQKNSRRSLFDWDKPLFEHKSGSIQKLLAKANKTTERATKFINKIKSRQLACDIRAKSILGNATIRKEYIKCGKEICEQKHGPYYYAYWKDPESKKLKKKYIGDHMPKDKEFDDDCNSKNLIL
jgi:hypothetical protein